MLKNQQKFGKIFCRTEPKFRSLPCSEQNRKARNGTERGQAEADIGSSKSRHPHLVQNLSIYLLDQRETENHDFKKDNYKYTLKIHFHTFWMNDKFVKLKNINFSEIDNFQLHKFVIHPKSVKLNLNVQTPESRKKLAMQYNYKFCLIN